MKLTVQHHAGNPNMCRIPELTIRQMPECEGGGWWMPRAQAEDLVSISVAGSVLTEEMEQAGFDALDEYAVMKANGIFPRPSLIAHLWNRMNAAADGVSTNDLSEVLGALGPFAEQADEYDARCGDPAADDDQTDWPSFQVADFRRARDARDRIASALGTNPHRLEPEGEDFSHDIKEHDCGEDTCVCCA